MSAGSEAAATYEREFGLPSGSVKFSKGKVAVSADHLERMLDYYRDRRD